ncbi:unnamed protein product [Cylicocyclus nassatus]|uniref:TAZ-type domain-containing protein n=1 Tax=Cylicocyclus nassatus TaxID=53992 RepID=A0AA36HGH3_CYLNA|nr:unnamed protein product [Cylicocyclus nassatus]
MGIEELGTKEELRDYLGSLIHALRSHKPCTNLRRSDPLWCGKISCLRLASQWCLMHDCWDSEKKCKDKRCMRSELVVTHWVNCTYARCFMCSPWIRPESLESEPKQFLDECFGTHCFLGRNIEPLLIKYREKVDKMYAAVNAAANSVDETESMQINVTIVNADSEEEDEDNVVFIMEDEAFIEFTCKAPATSPQNCVQNGTINNGQYSLNLSEL